MAAFNPDWAKADKDIAACLSCHAPLTETNFIFSIRSSGQLTRTAQSDDKSAARFPHKKKGQNRTAPQHIPLGEFLFKTGLSKPAAVVQKKPSWLSRPHSHRYL